MPSSKRASSNGNGKQARATARDHLACQRARNSEHDFSHATERARARSQSAKKAFDVSGMRKSASPKKTPGDKKSKKRRDDKWVIAFFLGVWQKDNPDIGAVMGEPTGTGFLCITPIYDDSAEYKAMMAERFPTVPEQKWNPSRKGFVVKVNSPQMAQDINTACRSIGNAAADLPEEVDLGDWEGPVVKILKLTGLDVDLYQGNYEDTDAIMLDSDVSLYELKDDLFAVDFEYVRSVGGKDGIDRYVHVVNTNAEGANVIRSAQAICTKYGFASDADFADVDASAW